MSENWIWIPNISLGPVVLGKDFHEYLLKLQLSEQFLEDEVTGWLSFLTPEKTISIDTENDKVVSITAYAEFIYKGRNLIGLNLIELGEILGVKADEIGTSVEYENGEVETPFEYFELGLEVWINNNCVSSISCTTYTET